MKADQRYIAIYLLLAFGLSLPVHFGYANSFHASISEGTILFGMTYVWAGLGPFLAGVIALYLNKNISQCITILSTDRLKNTAIFALPVVVFSVIGLNNEYGIDRHLFGFAYLLIIVSYAFLEEFGWRRYLQNALADMNEHLKYLAIGIIWWLWHARFASTFDLTIFPIICIGGGYMLGKLADEAKSIMPVVCMHALVILLTSTGDISKSHLFGAGTIVFIWVLIDRADHHNKKTKG